MIIISPAKKLNISLKGNFPKVTKPIFQKKTNELVNKIKQLDMLGIKNLMKVSESLAKLNHERFSVFNDKNTPEIPAGFLFSGDTFTGLSINSFNQSSLTYCQNNLRILSGLYGILRPFDLIKPHRLEMGTEIEPLLGFKLNVYWKKSNSLQLNEDIRKEKSKLLFNLSSKEYFKSIDTKIIEKDVINFDFKKLKNGKLYNLGMFIKRYRGMMANFIINKRIQTIDDLKEFSHDGFRFDSFDSSSKTLLFVLK